jgi:hypothetical protein
MTSPDYTTLKAVADNPPQRIQLQLGRDNSIQLRARPSQLNGISAQLGENFDRLGAPKQLGDCNGINAGINFEGPLGIEINRSPRAGDRHLNAPPIGNHRACLRHMTVTDNERRAIENRAVNTYLSWQSLQGVGVAFDLEPVQKSVNNGNIHTAHAVAETEFVQHDGIGLTEVVAKHFGK